MWGVETDRMCSAHLLGEHRELHLLVGALRACGTGRMHIHGHLRAGLIDLRLIASRHEELVEEFKRRGFMSGFLHDTPLSAKDIPEYTGQGAPGWINVQANEAELHARCKRC